MNVLVTGATGAVGPRVLQALCEADHRVRTFSLHHNPHLDVPLGVESSTGDIADSASLRRAVQDMDAVIHLAALLHIPNPSPEMDEAYERVNVRGTERVVQAALAAGVGRIVLASTIAVYGSAKGRVLDENSPPRPDSVYARTKLAAEQVMLQARDRKGRAVGVVLRLGAVYGARVKGNYERLVHALARHRFIPIGKGLNRRTLVYDRDAGRAFAIAAAHPAAAGRLFNVTDGGMHRLADIIDAICSGLGRRPPRFSVPLAFARLTVCGVEQGSRLLGIRPLVTRETLGKYTEDIAVEGRLIRDALGFTPLYDLRTGWNEAVSEMRFLGKLK